MLICRLIHFSKIKKMKVSRIGFFPKILQHHFLDEFCDRRIQECIGIKGLVGNPGISYDNLVHL